jgi:hypothetical protein
VNLQHIHNRHFDWKKSGFAHLYKADYVEFIPSRRPAPADAEAGSLLEVSAQFSIKDKDEQAVLAILTYSGILQVVESAGKNGAAGAKYFESVEGKGKLVAKCLVQVDSADGKQEDVIGFKTHADGGYPLGFPSLKRFRGGISPGT